MSNEQTIRPWWKLGPLAWLGILLLILVNIALFTDGIPFDRRAVAWLVHCLDPRRWPLMMACLLWGAVLWKALELPCFPKSARRHRSVIPLFTLIGVAVALFFQYDVYTLNVRKRIYYEFYIRYFVAPYANYLVDGRLHWMMLITPLTGATVLGSLIFLAVHLRKKNAHARKSESDPG